MAELTQAGTPRRRRPRGQLPNAIRDFLRPRNGKPATIAEITAGVHPLLGEVPSERYRAALQNEKYFERVSRGVFRLKAGA